MHKDLEKIFAKKVPVFLGPMAGVTDLPFRILCREQGADVVCTEMISAKAILYGNKNTEALLRFDECEHPAAVQLFGSDAEICADMAHRLEEGPWDIIDFNMGCPVPKIVNNGEGSAIMKDPEKAAEIIRSVVSRVSKPVTVKIRSGFDEKHINAVELARLLEKAGASAIAVHARTREQYYHGNADWKVIKDVKNAVSIPVIGNGDIKDPRSARAMLDETGCDGLMIARAALGNPWVFARIRTYLNEGTDSGDIREGNPLIIRDMMLRHLDMQTELDGEYMGIREMRKHIAWYIYGLRGAAAFRDKINRIEKLEELRNAIEAYFN